MRKCFVVPLDWRFSISTQTGFILNAMKKRELNGLVVFSMPTASLNFSLQMFDGSTKTFADCVTKQFRQRHRKHVERFIQRHELFANGDKMLRPLIVEYRNNDFLQTIPHSQFDMKKCGAVLKGMDQELLLSYFETHRYFFNDNDMKKIRNQFVSETVFQALVPTLLSIPARPVLVYCDFLQHTMTFALTRKIVAATWPKMEIKTIST